MKQNMKLPKKKIFMWCAIVVAVYVVLVVSLYFLMGQQLHFRTSRGEITTQKNDESLVADGAEYVQHFNAAVQRVQKISVLWGENQPTDSSEITLTVKFDGASEIAAEQKFYIKKSNQTQPTTIYFETPREDMNNRPMTLTVTVTDGWKPQLRATTEDSQTLFVDGEKKDFALNFEVLGQDYVWTGLYYWWLALGGLGIVGIVMLVAVLRYRKNNSSFIVNCFGSLSKYSFLIKQLVARDFKTKYKRSFFGVLWSFMNPLLTTIVMYFVFSNVFRGWEDTPNYTSYLIIGVTMFNFFSESCSMCLNSIVGNANLITKVSVPKYIYPFTKTLSSGINLALALIPMFLVVFFNRLTPAVSWILILFPFVCMMIFCYGLGMLLASSMVFFRDTQFLWGVISMLWMYLTPIFYPASIFPQQIRWVQMCNPMYHFIDFVRTCILFGVSPEPLNFVFCFASAALMLIVGGLIFKKTQNSFVLYI